MLLLTPDVQDAEVVLFAPRDLLLSGCTQPFCESLLNTTKVRFCVLDFIV